MKLNSIIKTFNKTLVQLNNLVEANKKTMAANSSFIESIKGNSLRLATESAKAMTISNNLKSLLGETK